MDGMQILTSHLTFILNECINGSVFPTMLKRATITPIFKKDDILDPKHKFPRISSRGLSCVDSVHLRGRTKPVGVPRRTWRQLSRLTAAVWAKGECTHFWSAKGASRGR